LGWLYKEPEKDARRLKLWIENCPLAERSVHEELRTPLSPREINDFSERGQNLDIFLKEIGKYRTPEDNVLRAGKRRQERLRELHQMVSSRSTMEEDPTEPRFDQQRPQTAADEKNLLPPETLERSELCETPLRGRGRGICGMAKEMGNFSKLERLCSATPFDRVAKIKHVIEFLAQHASSEEERAWMSFCWICSHIGHDCTDFACKSPDYVLPERVGGSWSIAKLFAAFCTELNVHAKVVTGHIRCSSSLAGDDVCADSSNRHWWNVVCFGSEWILIDCASGAAAQVGQQSGSFLPCFFGPSPEDLSFSHYPAEARWQLLPQPLAYEEFVAQVSVIPDVFTANGLEFLPCYRPSGIINLAATNSGCVRLRAPPGQVLQASVGGDASRCFISPPGSQNLKLKITVVGATNLMNKDRATSGKHDVSDPYCVCRIPGRGVVLFNTEVAMNKLNPRWNQTFVVDDLLSGDELQFSIFDKDIGTRDDLLGKVSVPTGHFFLGGRMDEQLDLTDDGAMKSKLQLRIEPAINQTESLAIPDPGITTINFRVPNGSGKHSLEIYTCPAGSSQESFRRACTFSIASRLDPTDFIEPCFPHVFRDTMRFYGLRFVEVLPKGLYVLRETNEIELCLKTTDTTPPGLQVVADVDGDRNATLAHISGNRVVIRARSPPGEHSLNIFARRDSSRQFACATICKLLVPADCAEVVTEPFPQVCALYREIGAALEAPLTGTLQPGLHRFRLCLPADIGDAKVMVSSGTSRDDLARQADGSFEGDVHVTAGDVTLLCDPGGKLPQPLLRWTMVGNKPVTHSTSMASRYSSAPS
jgi:hypothetical protein